MAEVLKVTYIIYFVSKFFSNIRSNSLVSLSAQTSSKAYSCIEWRWGYDEIKFSYYMRYSSTIRNYYMSSI